MKKTVALILCLVLFVFAAACKEEKKETTHGVDIAYFADMGSFPDSDLKLGDAVPEKKEEDETYFFTENGAESFVSNGDFCYYYNGKDSSPKIYGIAAFSNCLGFEVGAVSIEITDVLDEQKIKYTSREPGEGEIFFLPAGENREIIVCEGLKNNLCFVFEDNALCAAYLGDSTYGKDAK